PGGRQEPGRIPHRRARQGPRAAHRARPSRRTRGTPRRGAIRLGGGAGAMSVIVDVKGRRVWDSRGRPTVEAELRLACGTVGRAIAPAGASTGSGEALDLRDGGAAFGGYDVTHAVANVNGEIAGAVRGLDAADQAGLDAALIALDGTP